MDAGLALTPEIAIVLALIGFVVFALALDLLRADLVALLVLVVIGVAGILPVEQLFSGFGGDAVIAIIAMMILGAGLDRPASSPGSPASSCARPKAWNGACCSCSAP